MFPGSCGCPDLHRLRAPSGRRVLAVLCPPGLRLSQGEHRILGCVPRRPGLWGLRNWNSAPGPRSHLRVVSELPLELDPRLSAYKPVHAAKDTPSSKESSKVYQGLWDPGDGTVPALPSIRSTCLLSNLSGAPLGRIGGWK